MVVSYGFSPKNISLVFLVSTSIGDSIIPRRVYRNYVLSIFYRDTMTDIVELDIVEFDVILGLDWLYLYYASLDC